MFYNFTPGPSKLPKSVLQEIHNDLLDYEQGQSVMEVSHRSPKVVKMIESLTQLAEEFYAPMKVCWISGGGATLQFGAWIQNMVGPSDTVDFIVTGVWSKKAYQEAQRLIGDRARLIKNWQWRQDEATFVYYCWNETVDGYEFGFNQSVLQQFNCPYKNTKLISDISSNALSHTIPKDLLSQHEMLFAGVQKNIGPAGLTMIILRNVSEPVQTCPIGLSYKNAYDNQSLYNTPNVWSMYVSEKVLQWIKSFEFDGLKGLAAMEAQNKKKSSLLYQFISNSNGFYKCPVDEKFQSRMNVIVKCESKEVEDKFVEVSGKAGFIGLAGHRSVGGIRVSLYNAVTVEEVAALIQFMKEFQG